MIPSVTTPYELGMIACAASWGTSGKPLKNPYPENTLPWRLWQKGWDKEADNILKGR